MALYSYAANITRTVRGIRHRIETAGETVETMSRTNADLAHAAQDRCREAAVRAGFAETIGIGDFWDELRAPAAPMVQAEAEAKATWDAFQPAEGTIEWYDKFFVNIQDISPSWMNPHYYRQCLAALAEYRKEREEWGDDDAWISVLRDQFIEGEMMTAEFEREGKTGHDIPAVLAGDVR